MNLNVVVCADNMGGICKNGEFPWSDEETDEYADYLKSTIGDTGAVVMDSDTFDHINAHDNKLQTIINDQECVYVISASGEFDDTGAIKTVPSLRRVVEVAGKSYPATDLYIFGGLRLYIEALNYMPDIYMHILKNKFYQCTDTFPLQCLTKKYKIDSGIDSGDSYSIKYKSA